MFWINRQPVEADITAVAALTLDCSVACVDRRHKDYGDKVKDLTLKFGTASPKITVECATVRHCESSYRRFMRELHRPEIKTGFVVVKSAA